MPIFEFRCLECGHLFEKLFVHSDDRVELQCPECHASSVDRVVSRTNYAMGPGPGGKKVQVSTKSCGSGNSCVTLDLPGPTK
ncbi:MAG: zinc ribbon domain-containing protein [Deltaproteobacteria bacterium]|nr:zinc ribbon domain-containing protein [Deltaproteobacteria bacterium]